MNYIEAVKILGLNEDFTQEDVKKAYKLKVPQNHHDKASGNNTAMSELNEARDFLLKNDLIVVEKLEIAIRDMNQIALQHKTIDKKVDKFEKSALKSATSKLERYKRIAILLAGLSTAAIFLGKDIPKDILLGFQRSEIPSPAVVTKPIENDLIKKYKVSDATKSKDKKDIDLSSDFSSQEIVEIEKFDKENKKYIEYVLQVSRIAELNREIKQNNQNKTFYWYIFTFGLGIYSAFGAWFLNQKIHRIEENLSEINDDLLIKSNYFTILLDLFRGELPLEWSFQQLEDAISENGYKLRKLERIVHVIGTKKIAQLLILKGQEGQFISVVDGNKDNNYLEKYSVV
jgi:hypothetical protein